MATRQNTNPNNDLDSASSGTQTTSHDNDGDGALIVRCGQRGSNQANAQITGVTYNGVSMTQVVQSSTGQSLAASIWVLAAPATGINDVVVTRAGTQRTSTWIESYDDTHATTPMTTGVSANAGSGTATDLDVATPDFDELAIDVVAHLSEEVTTPGSGQTEQFDHTGGGVGAAGTDEAATADPTTMSQSWSTSAVHGEAACGINPAAAAVRVPPRFDYQPLLAQ